MKDWLLSLEPRERLLLAASAGVLVLLLVVLLVVLQTMESGLHTHLLMITRL